MATPFVPSASGDPTADLPEPSTFGKIQDEWNTFLGKPEGQAALLSFGINLMQPPHFGDTPMAQIGRAVGSAGETGTNIEKMDIAQQEAASKEALRGTTSELQTEKMRHLGDTLTAQAEKNRLMQENAQQGFGLKRLGLQFQLRKLYETEKQKFEGDIVNRPPVGSPGHEFKSFPEFVLSDPMAAAMAAEAGMSIPGTSTPTTTSSPKAPPEAPSNPAGRAPGTTYSTPKGPLKWTGTGWVSP